MADGITDGYPVAARKVAGLAGAGALVTVVAPTVDPSIEAIPAVRVERRPYRCGDLDGYRLVIAATGDQAVQQQVFDEGEAAGVWVNAADDPDRCTFILPAIERRGPVIIAVSTQGASPALAGYLRDRLAAALPANIEEVADELAAQRRLIRDAGGSTEDHDWKARIVEVFERFAG